MKILGMTEYERAKNQWYWYCQIERTPENDVLFYDTLAADMARLKDAWQELKNEIKELFK